MTLGLVCDACDTLSPLNATVCPVCNTPLGVINRSPTGSHRVLATDGPRICPSCNAEVAPGHRFCGNCGSPMIRA